MILLLFFAFFAGFTTILAPCIWPVLPIVLSSSLDGGHKRPLGIVLGIMASFTFFTLTISTFVRVFHINPNVLRVGAAGVIIALGLMMIFPPLATQFELLVARFVRLFGQDVRAKKSGFLPGFITGCSLGVMWSPCAGPILATIATLAATEQVSLAVVIVTIAYVAGVGVPLLVLAYGGQRLFVRARNVNKYTMLFQQLFGVVMIASALMILTNYDQVLQLQILNRYPALGAIVNPLQNNTLVAKQLTLLKKNKLQPAVLDTSGLFNTNQQAPELSPSTAWLNSKPLTLEELRGKVVLVDFWTYTCINCIRTLPHVTAWYDTYKDKGFVVIGVHTPEFQFEHDMANVQRAINTYHIHYPVVQDNAYATWNNFGNQYWPAEYLIDANGVIRRTHFGEGEYDQMEMAIRALLQEAGQKVTNKLDTKPDQTPHASLSPETYLGSARMQYYFPSGSIGNGTQRFAAHTPDVNSFSYGGTWTIANEYATAGQNATLAYHFVADKVYIILRPGTAHHPTVRVLLDGKVIDQTVSGADVKDGIITIDSDRLYSFIDLHGKTEDHTLQLEFLTPGVEAFTFTFG